MTELPADCPACHKRMWRETRLVKAIMDTGTGDDEGSFAVCMWCSSIWRLSRRNRWIKPTPAQLRTVLPILAPIALGFMEQRAMEAIVPDLLDRIDAFADAQKAARTKH